MKVVVFGRVGRHFFVGEHQSFNDKVSGGDGVEMRY